MYTHGPCGGLSSGKITGSCLCSRCPKSREEGRDKDGNNRGTLSDTELQSSFMQKEVVSPESFADMRFSYCFRVVNLSMAVSQDSNLTLARVPWLVAFLYSLSFIPKA